MGCNFDGGLTWLALGKARAGSDMVGEIHLRSR
jgi:hypothetical protein